MLNRSDILGVQHRIECRSLGSDKWQEISFNYENRSEQEMLLILNVLKHYFPTTRYRIMTYYDNGNTVEFYPENDDGPSIIVNM